MHIKWKLETQGVQIINGKSVLPPLLALFSLNYPKLAQNWKAKKYDFVYLMKAIEQGNTIQVKKYCFGQLITLNYP